MQLFVFYIFQIYDFFFFQDYWKHWQDKIVKIHFYLSIRLWNTFCNLNYKNIIFFYWLIKILLLNDTKILVYQKWKNCSEMFSFFLIFN